MNFSDIEIQTFDWIKPGQVWLVPKNTLNLPKPSYWSSVMYENEKLADSSSTKPYNYTINDMKRAVESLSDETKRQLDSVSVRADELRELSLMFKDEKVGRFIELTRKFNIHIN